MAVLEPAYGPGLAVEPGYRLVRLDRALVQKLDGHGLAELDTLAPIDDAHPAGAQFFDDFPAFIDDLADERVLRGGVARHPAAV